MSYCFDPDCQQPKNIVKEKFCSSCNTSLLLKDRYRGLKIIGQGGMGRTFLAIDEQNSEEQLYCVIKQLYLKSKNNCDRKTASRLFETEAAILNKLNQHPQIPLLHDYFTQDRYQYLVQEWIKGDNLRQVIAKKGPFSEQDVTQLLANLLPVVAFVHQFNIIHRDIKPENIIYCSNSKLVLVDFGASKSFTPNSLQQTGTIIGSPEYVAPEQLRGKATFGSDIYSLGVTCLYLLTGISPFNLYSDSEDAWVWRDYLGHKFISTKLGLVIDKMIAGGTSKRYQSIHEILQDLGIIASNSASARPNKISILSDVSVTHAKLLTTIKEPVIDCSQLQNYLETQNWKEANYETERLLLQATKQERKAWLERDDLETLACRDLQEIAKIWHDYSNAHFGFKVQNEIWQNLAVKDYHSFGKEIGWSIQRKWLRMNQLTFNLSAPKGHLPAITWWFGHAIWGLKSLFFKIDCCQK
ncbi:MAG: serine/threonine-protein kinase [Xenococcus sp. MO_188.B8]|nr:serine/threonine-protein kinase [Xenococcus sp. MO_188.B8]